MGLWNWWRKQVKQMALDSDAPEGNPVPKSRDITIEAIQDHLADMEDAVEKRVVVNNEPITVFFIKTLVEERNLHEMVFKPLQQAEGAPPQQALPLAEVLQQDQLPKLIDRLVRGHTILHFVQRNLWLQLNTFKVPQRSIDRPETESTVLGPQEAFVESLGANLSLIRRRIASPKLKIKTLVLGTETREPVAVLYMQDIANDENVHRLLHRVKHVEYQGFTSMSILKQILEDKPYSPFPQFGLTTRPDNVISALMDGRIAILNGSPDAVITPVSFFELFTSPEDFYNRWSTASLLRLLRFFGLFITVLLTSSYVSVLTYHPEMLPPALLTILSESRSRVPFPPVIEVLVIEIVIEILREAGVRMPTKIGQTIGIVGGIVIGTAAVEAGLASNVLIVVVSVSALLSFLPPSFLMSNAIRLVRYGFIIMAGAFGIFGQVLSLAFLFAHLNNLTSLGTPYMNPAIPREWSDLVNGILRAPIGYIMIRSGVSRAKKQLTRPLDEE